MKRDKFIKIRVSAEELAMIKDKAVKAEMKLSKYIRTSALNCKIFKYDTSHIYGFNQFMRGVGANINQIAAVVNSDKTVYENDIEDMKMCIKTISENFKEITKPLTCKEI